MSRSLFSETERFLPLKLGRTAHDTLQEFIDIDVSAGDLVRILNENQAYRDLFFRFVSQKTAKPEKPKEGEDKKKEPPSPTHRLVNLLGMLGSRNLVMALRIHRLADGRFPIKEDGKIDINAGDYLKRALEGEDSFQRNGLEYSETAYAAGVYFDLCRHVFEKSGDFKRLQPYFDRCWKRAFRTGVLAYLLAEKLAGFTPKYALAGGMMAHAGKVSLAVWKQNEGYAEFEEKLDDNKELPAIARMLLEREKFGLVAGKWERTPCATSTCSRSSPPRCGFSASPTASRGSTPTTTSSPCCSGSRTRWPAPGRCRWTRKTRSSRNGPTRDKARSRSAGPCSWK
jgi:hypothetical protein